MNSPETQSDSSSHESYFDPEVMDTSEQEFSASLESSGGSSGFVVDLPENVPTKSENVDRQAVGASEAQDRSDNASPQSSSPDWRDQVSAKVKNYKTLNPRKE